MLASLLSGFLPAKRIVTIIATGGHLRSDHRSDSKTINDNFNLIFFNVEQLLS